MDATVEQEGCQIHHEVLEVDDNGCTPSMPGFVPPDKSTIEIVINQDMEV